MLDALFERLGHGRVFVQVVIEVFLDEIQYEAAHSGAVLAHVEAAKLGFSLALEHGLLHPHRNGGDDGAAHVGGIVIFFVKLSHGFHHRLPEGGQVGATLGGILAVHEGIVLLAVVVAVGHGHLNILPFQVDDGVAQVFYIGLAGEQVEQTVFGIVLLAVEVNRETGVEINIVPNLIFEVFRDEAVVLENRIVGLKRDQRAVTLAGFLRLGVAYEAALGKLGGLDDALAHALHQKVPAQRIHGLGTHAVEADGLLKHFRIILAAGVDFAHYIDDLAQRNAAAVVAHLHP